MSILGPWQYLVDSSRPSDKILWSTITFVQFRSSFFLGSAMQPWKVHDFWRPPPPQKKKKKKTLKNIFKYLMWIRYGTVTKTLHRKQNKFARIC